MSEALSKTPAGMDRRQFVKVAAGAAGFAAVGATAVAMGNSIVQLGRTRSRTIEYLGLDRTEDSKAPRGLPLIPVRVNEDGLVEGIPDRLDWYRYCGRDQDAGLQPTYAGDDVFRFFRADEGLLQQLETHPADAWWHPSRVGQPIRALDMASRPVGDAVPFRWRSAGVPVAEVLTGLLLRIDASALTGPGAQDALPLVDATNGLMAVFTTCWHFCCVPGYREANPRKHLSGPWQHIYCTCHGSWYHPTKIMKYRFELVEQVPPSAVTP